MNPQARRIAYLSAFIVILTAISAFINITIVTSSYWRDLSGLNSKDWAAGTFVQYAHSIVILYVMVVGATIWAFVEYYRCEPKLRVRWIIAPLVLHVCQFYSFDFFYASFYLIMKFEMFGDNVTPQITSLWNFYEKLSWGSIAVLTILTVTCTLSILLPQADQSKPSD